MVFASLLGLIYPETPRRNDCVLQDLEQTAERATPARITSGVISPRAAN